MKRIFGLDIIRALAITLVILDHSWYFNPISNPSKPNPLNAAGFFGVELFFVLSGFLIGKIAFRSINDFKSHKLKTFYLRRWLRTLPLYYLLLTLFIIFSNFIYHTHDIHPLHFIFLQNFIGKESDFFSIAWSLSIEEWFYLLLPVFLMLISTKIKTKKGYLLSILSAILLILGIRIIVVLTQHLGFQDVRKSISLRFDSLLIGVLLAGFKIYYEEYYKKLQELFIFLCSILVLLILSSYFTFLVVANLIDKSIFFKSAGFTVISFSIAGLIPFLESSSFINTKIASNSLAYKIITGISIISYSLYLTHLEIYTLFIKYFSHKIPFMLLFAISTMAAISISIVLYNIVEKPIMNMRDKITSANLYRLNFFKTAVYSLKQFLF